RTLYLVSPMTGLWKLDIQAEAEGAYGIVPSWEVAGASGPLLLVSREYDTTTQVSLTVPGELGVLSSFVMGDSAHHSVLRSGSAVCDGPSCDLVFPGAGTWTFDADQGPGYLEVSWTPTELVLDQQTAGGTQTYAIEVPAGSTHLLARAEEAQSLKLRRGSVALCEGVDRCQVEQPVAGTWIVEVSHPASVHVEAGVVGAAITPPPPAPPTEPDDHGNDVASATSIQLGTLDAHLGFGDSDWFYLSGWAEGAVVESLGDVDTIGTLYDMAGNAIVATNDDGGHGLNFRLEVPVSAYYLEVRGYTDGREGDYMLVYGLPNEGDEVQPDPAVPTGLVMNELLASPTTDANCDGVVDAADDEFVEIVNAGPTTVDTTGLTLSDAGLVRHVFGSLALEPGEVVVVWGGGSPTCALPAGVAQQLASTGGLGLNNGGDTVSLRTAAGLELDLVSYEPVSPGISLTRVPELDTTAPLVEHDAVTAFAASPGYRADGTTF
ncbi:MAG: lamin tail domain-containing protein, partial [Myxococcales bacterium]|nr:lamin tail domain-containing protein [Myxococcales bacterium]